MDKMKYLKLLLALAGSGIMFYSGYLYGTRSIRNAYGEVMSAEAIMYLAAKESQNE